MLCDNGLSAWQKLSFHKQRLLLYKYLTAVIKTIKKQQMYIIIIIHEFHGDTSLKQNFRAAVNVTY